MSDRRAFLRQLAGLPLIGGSVALIGQPTAAAEEPTLGTLVQYANWLFYERRMLANEIHDIAGIDVSGVAFLRPPSRGDNRYWPDYFSQTIGDVYRPSARAAVVMSAAGFDWRPHVR